MNVVKRLWNYFSKPVDSKKIVIDISELPQIVANIQTYLNGNTNVFDSVVKLRMISAQVGNPHIDEVVESGVVPTLVRILTEDKNPSMQLESSWILTNIASGTEQNTKFVVGLGMVPVFSSMVAGSSSSLSSEILHQALWGLGNIAGSTDISLKELVEHHAFNLIFKIFEESDEVVVVQELSSWVLYNICHHNPSVNDNVVSKLIPAMGRVIGVHMSNKRKWDDEELNKKDMILEKGRESSKKEIVTHCIWALAEMTLHQSSFSVKLLLDNNIVPILIKILKHTDSELVVQTLYILGEIMAGNDLQTQAVLDLDIVKSIEELLIIKNDIGILSQATWIISNIAAGTRPQVQYLVDANMFTLVIEKAKNINHIDMQKHKAWTLSNAASGGSVSQIDYLVKINIIPELFIALPHLISINSTKDIVSVLEAVINILKKGKEFKKHEKEARYKYYIRLVKEHGRQVLDSLTSHPDAVVRKWCLRIFSSHLECYDTDDESEEDSNNNINNTEDSKYLDNYESYDSDDSSNISDSSEYLSDDNV